MTGVLAPSQKHSKSLGFVTCENCGGAVPLRSTGRPRVHAFCDDPECRRVAAATRAKASRTGRRLRPIDPPMPDHVRTVYGNNSDLIAAAARLYIDDGVIVADVTWGEAGVFWKRFNGRRRFTLIGSDIRDPRELAGVMVRADFRQLPYADGSIDVAVLDPPYGRCGHYYNNHRYGITLTRAGALRHPEVMKLYRAGMVEARRVLRPGGTLWVKCQDDDRNWSHITLFNFATTELGLSARDLFILAPRPAPTRRHQRQKHALKTHSYLWIFRKPRRATP